MYSLAGKPKSRIDEGAQSRHLDLRARLLALPRYRKRALQVIADIALIWLSLWLAFYLRLDNAWIAQPLGVHAWLFALAPILTIPILAKANLYRAVLRYLGMQTLWAVVKAISMAAILMAIAVWM